VTVRGVASVGLLAALLTACAGRTAQVPESEPDPQRARAALATLHVDNQSPHSLTVSYRIAGSGGGRVEIGRVDASSHAEMAPVPAGEPLILTARTSAGAELILAPRTFTIDGSWTWRIDRAARFIVPPNDR
jgi:hypothetical protein